MSVKCVSFTGRMSDAGLDMSAKYNRIMRTNLTPTTTKHNTR